MSELTWLITGSSRGFGRALATAALAAGDRVVVTARNPAQVADLAEQYRDRAIAVPMDVTDQAAVRTAFESALERFGRLDVVVNNAGLMTFKPLEEFTPEDWREVVQVDLLGAVHFTREAFHRMGPGGAIVNIASVHAIMTTPNVAPYAAAKAALLSLTRSAAIEGKPKGIRANAILPGAIDTPMLWSNPNLKSGAEKLDPKDVGKPEHIASAVAFLASDDAAFVTGASLAVDGGRLAQL